MDLSMNVCKIPAEGETITDDGGVAYTPGGKGANSAIALNRLGAECVFCTKLGADVHGQKLYSFYKEVGLNTSHIKVDHDHPTGFAVVIKEFNGQNRIIHYPGANNHITTENIIESFACRPDALYLGFEISFPAALAAAKVASTKGIPIFVDAAPAKREHDLESLPYMEVFSPNETETYEYTGIMPAGADSALRAALALRRRVNCKYIVIKQGARGAFIYDGKHYNVVPSYRPDKVVDTTAAGDAFTAALTIEYLKTGDIMRAAKYAAAAGAVTVSREGASLSIPSEAEVRAFLEKRSYL